MSIMFEEAINEIRPTIQKYKKTPIRLSNIHKKENNFFYEEKSLTNAALKDLLNILSIKSTLVDEIQSDKEQWEPLQQSIADIKQDRVITAIHTEEGGQATIIQLHNTACESESTLNLDKGIKLLEGFLQTQTNNKVVVKKVNFNTHTLQLEAQFYDNTSQVDVFENQSDMWGSGFEAAYGEKKLHVSPFFWRQVCSNGMTVNHMASQRYFNSQNFKQNSFNRLIQNTLNKDLKSVAKKNCTRLVNNKVSLREFYNTKNILLAETKELAEQYFDDAHIREAYKDEKIRSKNSRWLSTANSNINAYEFFNNITHCATHQNIQDVTRLQLNRAASELFFNGPDLSFRAPDPFFKE